jgi:Protein of unknown function (DUF2478)
VQVLFQDMVDRWRASRIQVAGLIERPHGLADRRCNAGVLYDIANGRPHSIFRETVQRSDACHIDVAGAEAAIGWKAASDDRVKSSSGGLGRI